MRYCPSPADPRADAVSLFAAAPPLWLGGRHRAVANRPRQCCLQIARQLDLGFSLRDERMSGLTLLIPETHGIS